MKNIHLLLTDKLSKLHEYDYLSPMGISKEPLQWRLGRNIYIISDEFIDNDWVLNTISGKVFFNNTKLDLVLPVTKKIILTTDPKLIENGVQAIDDEFLEWFIKNPSCEEVEVIKKQYHQFVGNTKLPLKPNYKVIIPKEEPKQDYSGVHLRHCYQGEYEDGCKYGEDNCPAKPLEEPKQETTLEEVAERIVREHPDFEAEGFSEYQNGRFNGIIEGIEFQQKISYSKEEVRIMYRSLWAGNSFDFDTSYEMESNFEHDFNLWFEQVKKK